MAREARQSGSERDGSERDGSERDGSERDGSGHDGSDLQPEGRRPNRWRAVFFVVFATVIVVGLAAYFVPLSRAHSLLAAQFRDLSQKAQKQSEKLAHTETELETVKRTLDLLETEKKERDASAKAESDRFELIRGELQPRLDKLGNKGSSLSFLPNRAGLLVAIDEAAVLLPAKAKVSPPGQTFLCDLAKIAGAAGAASVRAIHTAGKTGRAPSPFESVFAWSSARAGAVAQALSTCAGKEPARILAVGAGRHDPYLDLLVSAKLPPGRIEVVILPAAATP